MNDIFFRRRGRIQVNPGEGGATAAQVASAEREAEAIGFVFSEALTARLLTLSTQELTGFLRMLLGVLRPFVGAHRKHVPLYPNFPRDVMAASEATLYLNAVRHYLSLRRPASDPDPRPALLNARAPRVIELGDTEAFERVFTQLAGARTSLSAQDKLDAEWFVRQYRGDVHRLLPKQLPFKENVALVAAWLATHAPGDATDAFLQAQLKTPTDVLRWVVALDGGDVSLAQPTKFKPRKRRERRAVLALLERGEPTEDMRRWPERWKRLGEILHPGEFAARHPKAAAAFDVLRNDRPFESFNQRVELALESGSIDAAVATLAARPGELARRLDVLLRRSADPQRACATFERCAARVSTPVLLQVLSHFRQRATPQDLRSFFPKGDVAKVFAMRDRRAAIDAATSARIAQACEAALIGRFAAQPALGRCFVDPALANYLAPLSQRSASKALRTLVRGSRLPMPDAAIVRLFVWWKNGRSRTDIDLSAAFYDTDFRFVEQLTYYRLKNWGGYHSGDIVDAPQGAAEFIDLDLARLRAGGARFVVASLFSYTSQPYCDLPECFTGWMARSDANSGEPFEPKTVEDRVDIASDAQVCLPFAFDLLRNEVLWMDVALGPGLGWNNLNNNLSGVSLLLRALSSLRKPDLHMLFTLHARARGELVDEASTADTVFSPHAGVTPFDVDRIRADFL